MALDSGYGSSRAPAGGFCQPHRRQQPCGEGERCAEKEDR